MSGRCTKGLRSVEASIDRRADRLSILVTRVILKTSYFGCCEADLGLPAMSPYMFRGFCCLY